MIKASGTVFVMEDLSQPQKVKWATTDDLYNRNPRWGITTDDLMKIMYPKLWRINNGMAINSNVFCRGSSDSIYTGIFHKRIVQNRCGSDTKTDSMLRT